MLANRRKLPPIVKFLIGLGIVLEVLSTLLISGQVTLADIFGSHYVVLTQHSITPAMVGVIVQILGYFALIEGLLVFIYPAPKKQRKSLKAYFTKKNGMNAVRVILFVIGVLNIYEYSVGISSNTTLPIGGVSLIMGISLDHLIHLAASAIGFVRNILVFTK